VTSPAAVAGRAAKRVVDVVLAAAILPVVLPVIGVLAALVRLESRGPAIFRQTRVGRGGRPFTVLKLRTMVLNAENLGAGIFFEANDPRITRVGAFMRRFSLDELPQVFNILRGEMSVVGPRPMLPVTVETYREDYDVILRVRPGVTGLSQVSGRNALPRSERLRLDREYALHHTLRGDIAILARTFGVALTGEGQLNDQSAADVER
jgi:lipopolysaccharide/colanic/teichoic acid biosynthesis glycosyltransferase